MPFHKLDVYRKAYDASLRLHTETLSFPRFEQSELASQLRRASKSICANIAEGMGRQMSPKDVVRFLRSALGSCDETRIWLEYSRDLEYLPPAKFDEMNAAYCEVGRMVNGLVQSWIARCHKS